MRKKSLFFMLSAVGLYILAPCALADWSAAKRLTWNTGGSADPAIAVDSDDSIHLVWEDSTPGNYEIYYKQSEDGGTTWSPVKRLTWTSGWSSSPAITSDSGGTIHIIWYDDTPGNREVYYKKSTNNGSTWSAAKRITWTSAETSRPAIAVDSNNNIHVAWHDFTPGNAEIYYRRSTDGGTSWSTVQRLTWTADYSEDPAIAIDSTDVIHVAWRDNTPGNEEIYIKSSTNSGKTWSIPKRLTWSSGWSQYPAIAIDSNDTLHLVWDDPTSGNAEIYYKKSTDRGATWSSMKRLTWTSGGSFGPDMAVDSTGHIHVVWEDFTPGLPDIYHKSSPDGGTTWSAVERITWTSGQSMSPAIAADSSGTVHVVWHDDTPGKSEIYYKKGS
jgi:hypothetical protein